MDVVGNWQESRKPIIRILSPSSFFYPFIYLYNQYIQTNPIIDKKQVLINFLNIIRCCPPNMHTSVYFWGAIVTSYRVLCALQTPIHTFMHTPYVRDQLTKAQDLIKLLWSGLQPKGSVESIYAVKLY